MTSENGPRVYGTPLKRRISGGLTPRRSRTLDSRVRCSRQTHTGVTQPSRHPVRMTRTQPRGQCAAISILTGAVGITKCTPTTAAHSCTSVLSVGRQASENPIHNRPVTGAHHNITRPSSHAPPTRMSTLDGRHPHSITTTPSIQKTSSAHPHIQP